MSKASIFVNSLIEPKSKKNIWNFFLLFSRFECALKMAGYIRSGNKDNAEADWDEFAKKTASRFDSTANSELKEACGYFSEHPPKKQIRSADKTLSWKICNYSTKPEFERLCLRLRCVRNNLFHGGKFPHPTGPVEEIARNAVLIRHSIVILNALIELDTNVSDSFFKAPDAIGSESGD